MTVKKLLVCGSRDYPDLETVKGVVIYAAIDKETGDDMMVITGGARGVDTAAIEACEEYHIPIITVLAINPSDKLSYLFRNAEMIGMADSVLAFWDGKSKGTKFVIDYCKARGKTLRVVEPRDLR
jgi:predicted Rossmann fold nucleotide-binding protein DprA/Smf involved in DNA uptake